MARGKREEDEAVAERPRFPVRDMWVEGAAEKTVPLRTRRAAAEFAGGGDAAVRDAWIRTVSGKREIDEDQAARLWDADVSLIPKEVFSAGFYSREADIEQRDLRIAAAEDELREEGRRTEALLMELEEKTERIERLQGEGEKVRRLLKALAVLAAASAREEIASDPERMTQIAFSVLNDFSVVGGSENGYSSRPVYVGAAAAFRKLRERGDSAELASLYRDLSALLHDMEPDFHSAEERLLRQGSSSSPAEPGEAAEGEGS